MLDSPVFQQIALYYLLFVNTICLILFAVDKRRARRGGWRVPEKTLFLWGILGGSLGGLLGMHVLRHKTRHAKFVWGFPLIFLLQAVLLFYMLG